MGDRGCDGAQHFWKERRGWECGLFGMNRVIGLAPRAREGEDKKGGKEGEREEKKRERLAR